MGIACLPAALMGVTLIAIVTVRPRSVATKLACEAVLVSAIGGYLVLRGTTPLPGANEMTGATDGGWLRALAVMWWLVGARFGATTMALALGRDARSRQARLFSDLVAGAIYVTATLIVLNSVLDLPIKGLVATSGVIAIVLGLALQNTLADVFSGIAVGVEQPFHVGDRVTIADHAEGVIVEMNWRSIRIQTDGEDVATIPNSVVARNQIVNRSVPIERRLDTVDIPTRSMLPCATLRELIQQATLLSPAIMEQPPPTVLVKALSRRTTIFRVKYHVANTPALEVARSQLLHQVRHLFRCANVLSGEEQTHASLLGSLVLFDSLTANQIDQLCDAVIRRRLDPGETVFEQGSHGAALYVIRSGVYEITRAEEDGRRTMLGRVGPGEYIGEISMMTGDPRPGHVMALSSGEVLELPKSAIETLLSEDGSVSAALERSVLRSLKRFDRDPNLRSHVVPDGRDTLLGRIRSFLAVSAV